jgi:hypothetical protein
VREGSYGLIQTARTGPYCPAAEQAVSRPYNQPTTAVLEAVQPQHCELSLLGQTAKETGPYKLEKVQKIAVIIFCV